MQQQGAGMRWKDGHWRGRPPGLSPGGRLLQHLCQVVRAGEQPQPQPGSAATVDLRQLKFPDYIALASLRPDTGMSAACLKQMLLIELTVRWEDCMEEGDKRKEVGASHAGMTDLKHPMTSSLNVTQVLSKGILGCNFKPKAKFDVLEICTVGLSHCFKPQVIAMEALK